MRSEENSQAGGRPSVQCLLVRPALYIRIYCALPGLRLPFVWRDWGGVYLRMFRRNGVFSGPNIALMPSLALWEEER